MKLLNIALILTSLAFTSSAAPTEPSAPAHDVAPTFPAPRSAPPLGNYCGKALITGLGQQGELRTSEPWNKCNTLDQGLSYGLGMNPYCGLCVMFKDDDCQGDITYWGGRGTDTFDAKGARSYYCV